MVNDFLQLRTAPAKRLIKLEIGAAAFLLPIAIAGGFGAFWAALLARRLGGRNRCGGAFGHGFLFGIHARKIGAQQGGGKGHFVAAPF